METTNQIPEVKSKNAHFIERLHNGQLFRIENTADSSFYFFQPSTEGVKGSISKVLIFKDDPYRAAVKRHEIAVTTINEDGITGFTFILGQLIKVSTSWSQIEFTNKNISEITFNL